MPEIMPANTSGKYMTLDQQISKVCRQAVDDHIFPGCSVAYFKDNMEVVLPFGRLTYETDAPAVTSQTVYDVASITKSIPTSCVLLGFIEEGLLSLDDRVIDYIPELQNDYRENILVRHLLTYTVIFDLPGGISKIAKAEPSRLLELLFAAPLMSPPGERYYYTNPPAILMGLIAERIAKKPINELAAEKFRPLRMNRTMFSPGQFGRDEIAPTEIDFRGELRGIVHDEAAWAMAREGRRSGHAGLFSTAQNLLIFARMLLNGGSLNGVRFYDPETVALMHTNQLEQLGESAALGWELNLPNIMGDQGSNQIFGKTGFTGCIVLIDPVRKAALVQLSNRTYPNRPQNRTELNVCRRALADLVFAAS